MILETGNTQSQPEPGNSKTSFQTNLYIRGLAPNITDDELRRMCEEFGKITSTKAIMDKMTNTCKVRRATISNSLTQCKK